MNLYNGLEEFPQKADITLFISYKCCYTDGLMPDLHFVLSSILNFEELLSKLSITYFNLKLSDNDHGPSNHSILSGYIQKTLICSLSVILEKYKTH